MTKGYIVVNKCNVVLAMYPVGYNYEATFRIVCEKYVAHWHLEDNRCHKEIIEDGLYDNADLNISMIWLNNKNGYNCD